MEAVHSPQSHTNPPDGPVLPVFIDAIHFWELRRLFYNLALIAAAIFWLVATWPHFRPAFTLHSLFLLSILALMANACYCVAYLSIFPCRCPLSASPGNVIAGSSGWLELFSHCSS